MNWKLKVVAKSMNRWRWPGRDYPSFDNRRIDTGLPSPWRWRFRDDAIQWTTNNRGSRDERRIVRQRLFVVSKIELIGGFSYRSSYASNSS